MATHCILVLCCCSGQREGQTEVQGRIESNAGWDLNQSCRVVDPTPQPVHSPAVPGWMSRNHVCTAGHSNWSCDSHKSPRIHSFIKIWWRVSHLDDLFADRKWMARRRRRRRPELELKSRAGKGIRVVARKWWFSISKDIILKEEAIN